MEKGVKGVWDKYKYAALIILTGVILMILPKTAGNTAKTDNTGKSGIFENLTGDLSDGSTSDLRMNPAAGDTRDIREIQREMEETLGRVSGVGRVKVLLTEEDDGERNLAEDISLNTRGETEDYSRESRTVLIDAGSGDGYGDSDADAASGVSGGVDCLRGRGSGVGTAGGDAGGVGVDGTFRGENRGGKMGGKRVSDPGRDNQTSFDKNKNPGWDNQPERDKNPGRDKKQDKKRGKKIGVKPSIVIWRKKRMGSRWKRNAVIGTMVVLVGAAAALNWRYTSLDRLDMEAASGTASGLKTSI